MQIGDKLMLRPTVFGGGADIVPARERGRWSRSAGRCGRRWDRLAPGRMQRTSGSCAGEDTAL